MTKKSTYWTSLQNLHLSSMVLLLFSVLGSSSLPAGAAAKAKSTIPASTSEEKTFRKTKAGIFLQEAPAFEADQYTFTSPEKVALGTKVGQVKALDADNEALVYRLTAGNTNETFTIDAAGSIKVTKLLNHHTQNSYKLTVKVIDAVGLTDQTAVSITITPTPELPAISQISWNSAANQPYPFYEGQGKAVNGKLYTFSGFDSQKSGFTPTSRAHVFDPQANTWTPLAPMPPMNGTNYGGVTHAGFTTDHTDIYFAGGYTASSNGKGQILGTAEVWKYVVSENRYLRLPDLPRISAAGQLEYLQGKLHYIAGTDRRKKIDIGDHYVLDLEDMATGWKTLAPLPSPRQHAGSAVYKGKIYFVGGQTGHDAGSVATKLVHVYDPETNEWTRLADIPAPEGTPGIAHISSSVIIQGNQIIVLGGEFAFSRGTRMVSAYSPATNTWVNLTSLPILMRGGVGASIGSKIYYTGGRGVKATYSGTPLTNQKISSLSLVNADNGNNIRLLGKNATVNLANLPSRNVTILATTNPETVGSVAFKLAGPQTQTLTESKMPYALFGDKANKYIAWNPPVGEYTLEVTPYSAANGMGLAGSTLRINFTILDSFPERTSSEDLSGPIDETHIAPKLQVYPNPKKVNQQVFIGLENFGKREKVVVTLHDIAGRALTEQAIVTNDQGQIDAEVSISESVRAGVYLIRVNAGSGNQQVKLLIQE